MPCPDLASSCPDCLGLCCVATSFDRGPAFAFSKASGEACQHLTAAHRCAIHAAREHLGMSGCLGYECHGAGQRASALALDDDARQRTFLALRELHELLWLLTEAARLCPASHQELRAELAAQVQALADVPARRPALEAALRQREPGARALLRQVGDALGGRGRWETDRGAALVPPARLVRRSAAARSPRTR